MSRLFRSKSTIGKVTECAIGFGVLLLLASFFVDLNPFGKRLPSGYEQILPRGRIRAITEPNHVNAENAKVGDENHVLGVVVEGQPIAYSLNLLNFHEVVNDEVGDTCFAAVW